MNPLSRFTRTLFNWESKFLAAMGHDFIGRDFRPNFLTYSLRLYAMILFISGIYTIVNYEIEVKIFGLFMVLAVFQVSH